MNVKQLVTLIQIATSEDAEESTSTVKGKKRAPPTLSDRVRTPKRMKMSNGSIIGGMSEAAPMVPDVYPQLSSERYDKSLNDVEAIPTFQHVYEIQYSRVPPSSVVMGSDDKSHSGWNSEEKYLLEALAELRSSLSEPKTIDLGTVHFADHYGRLVVKGREGWLLLLPSLASDIDLAWHGLASQSVEDIIMAFYILQSAGRVRINGRLDMVVYPSTVDGTAEQGLPLRLHIIANVSLLVPTIFAPIVARGTKWASSEIGDAQRRALNFLYPSAAPIPDSFDGAINIPFLYSILCPAPPSFSPSAHKALQPIELIPTLLPFQRRSVAWLLDREGITVTADGELVPKVASDDFTLWDKVEQGSNTWYLHRLSGLLSPSLPQTHPVFGGILAEEPGLGKTLETIALILLNPAPQDRNPTVKRWDPEAKLEVRAIKVCDTIDS